MSIPFGKCDASLIPKPGLARVWCEKLDHSDTTWHVNGDGNGALTWSDQAEGAARTPSLEVDLVNHPPHYGAHPSGVECIQITEHMGFNIGNALKYLWRADEKGNAEADLKKARWYVDREIQRRGYVK